MLTARAVFWLGALYGLVCGLCLAACAASYRAVRRIMLGVRWFFLWSE